MGGNVCGQIPYREAVLSYLLTDSEVIVAGEDGVRPVSIHQIFNKQIQLKQGEFVLQFKTDQVYLQMPYVALKKRKQGSIGYPLVTVAAIRKGDQIRMAFSGLCAFPFRDQNMEDALNQKQEATKSRIEHALSLLPDSIADDVMGSAEYRRFVAGHATMDILLSLEGEHHAL